MPSAPTRTPAERLRGLCGGAVHLPGDPGYDDARAAWNTTVDARPAAVAYPAFPDEVAAVLTAAADVGLRVAVQGTGHGAGAMAEQLDGAVLLRTSALTGVVVDPDRASARVSAGVLWGDLVARSAPHGLTGRHMSSPDVGVVGSSLGGGISWFARAHGLQSTALTAVELVLPDGTLVRSDTDGDDLLWAARGGGGGFGVVTAVEFDLLPIGTAVAGMLAWDWADAERVLRAWSAWAVDAPEEITTCLRLLTAPDSPEVPAEVRGRRLVLVDGAVVGDLSRAPEVLAPLRALRPALDTFGEVATAALPHLHLEPQGPTPGYATSALVSGLPDAAVDALLAATADAPASVSALQIAEVRQLGGALARPAGRDAALDRVDGAFMVLGIGVEPDRTSWGRLRDDASRVTAAVEPWSSGLYLPMLDEAPASTAGGRTAGSADRLARVRREADPHGLLVSAFS